VLRNYLLATLRNLARNRVVSAINIVGLAIGIAAALLIALYLRFQYSFESGFPGYQRIYRVSMESRGAPGFPAVIWDNADLRMAEQLRNDYPQIERAARLVDQWFSIRHGDLEFHEQVYTADPDFFRLLQVRAIAGDPLTALESPDNVIITRQIAKKYFGDEPALGKTLDLDRYFPLRVAAVIEDLPGNTHFNFRIVASAKAQFSTMSFAAQMQGTGTFFPGFHTYFSLRPGAKLAEIESSMPAFLARHYDAGMAENTIVHLYRLTDVHLSPPGRWPMSPPTDPRTLRTLGLVGLLVIALAIINFVNLMTARALQRATEIGVRKSAGAGRGHIMLQFLGEAFLYVLASMLLAMALVEIALPTFNAMLATGEEIYPNAHVTFEYWRDPRLAGALLLAALGLTVLAGAYPAFVMSSFKPAWALKRGAVPGGASHVRQALVVLQFATLIGLAFATVVIHRQTTFAMNDGLRINRDQVMLMHFNMAEGAGDGIVAALGEIPGVKGVTGAAALPTNYNISALTFTYQGSAPALLQFAAIDYNFFDFYGLAPLAGRLPSRKFGTDLLTPASTTLSVTVNESATRQFGFSTPQEAIGKTLTVFGPTGAWTPPSSFVIVGVVPDFPIDSMRGSIKPTMFNVDTTQRRILSIRLEGRRIPETLAAIDDVWRRLGEPHAVSRWFLEQYYHRMYLDVLQQRMVLTTLSGVAVFLAVLGLFGLSIYTAQRRTKEIGIRKVMGADTGNLMALLLWAFSKPVLWASLLAWPVAAWAMNRWLDGFAYRVPLGWWWLPVATLAALAVALLTVSAQSYLVARASPASALRYE
jgi:putative ABC transport system permease protein